MRRRIPAIEQRLAEIDQLDLPSLRAAWAAGFGEAASARLSRDLLRRAIAYRLQEQKDGGLRPATIRRLRRLAEDLRAGEAVVTSAPTLQPGVRLMREWNGETHVVEVLAGGFSWRGAAYQSLSAIARAITGVRWSGPRFFGLLGSPSRAAPTRSGNGGGQAAP
jgi:Protein of unknown function (DUF2924)